MLVSWCPLDGQSVTEGGCGVGGGGEEGRATSRERPLTLKRFHSHSGNISRSMKKKEFRNKKIKKERTTGRGTPVAVTILALPLKRKTKNEI